MKAPDISPIILPQEPPLGEDPVYVPFRRPIGYRTWRFFADHCVIHITLLVLALLFIFPFLWMIGMSIKTDEEATSPTAFPDVPSFRADSPYVMTPAAVPRPAMANAGSWKQIYPKLKIEAREALSHLPLPIGTPKGEGGKLRDDAAIEVVGKGVGRLDETLWSTPGDDPIILNRFKQNLSKPMLTSSLDDRLGRFELNGIEARSLSGDVHAIQVHGPLWTVVSGDATLIPTSSGQILQYHFTSASAPPIVLHTNFNADLTPAQLYRLVVSYKGDASWHHLDAALQLGNQKYVTDLTTYIAQHRGASLLLQPPTFQDKTLAAHDWVPLKPIGTIKSAAGSPTQASLTLTLRPSSTLRAVWGKVQRNYQRAFQSVPFWTYVRNSVILVVLQMVGAIFSSGFVGYAFARLNWPGRSVAFGLLLSTMMLPSQVTMIPGFLIWRALGWYNTLNPLWIGAWFGNAFFIFLMVQNMKAIPRELDDAARIDGMNSLQTWWYVIMPQVKPTLAAIAILTFMGAWNDFMGPLIMLRDQTKFPLSLGLFSMRIDAGSDWPLIMAGNLLMTLPVILIFFLFQRYFIEGVTVTGLKG